MKVWRLILIALILGVSVFLIGCDPAADPKNVSQNSSVGAVDYGNGVYYFDSIGANFGNDLAAFIASHPDLELVAMTGNGTGTYGEDGGYFVVFKKK